MSSIPGLRSTDDWVANARPENWREAIMMEYPNGDAPLTALLARMDERRVDDPVFHWWAQGLPNQRATASEVYVDAALTTAYVYVTHQATYGVAGATVYIKMSSSDASQFRYGHQVLLRDADQPAVDVVGKVTNTQSNGASSFIAVKLLEADDNGGATYNIASVDTVLIVGNINPEGGEMPVAMYNDPTEFSNYTQIFRNSSDLTRTTIQTHTRLGKDPLKEAQRQALEFHSIEMEKAFWWSVKTANVGSNGKPERTTLGIMPMIKTYVPNNVFNYTTDADYSGKTWKQGGRDWLDSKLEVVFRYGRDTKMAFGGSGATLGLNVLAQTFGNMQMRKDDIGFGSKVTEWTTPFGVMNLKRHPLFSYEPTNSHTMVILEPERLKYAYIQDTMFKPDKSWREGGLGALDAVQEEYLTECGLEYHFVNTFAIFEGMGQDNVV